MLLQQIVDIRMLELPEFVGFRSGVRSSPLVPPVDLPAVRDRRLLLRSAAKAKAPME